MQCDGCGGSGSCDPCGGYGCGPDSSANARDGLECEVCSGYGVCPDCCGEGETNDDDGAADAVSEGVEA